MRSSKIQRNVSEKVNSSSSCVPNNLKSIELKKNNVICFGNLEKAVHELKQAYAVITEQEKLNCILKSLLQNFNHVGDLIDVLPERGRTVEYLKKNLSKEIQMKNRMKR